MDLNIFTKKVDDLVNEFNLKQSAAAGNNAAVKSNFTLFQARAEELSQEFRNAQKDVPNIILDHRKALYKLDLLIQKLKEKKEMAISLPSNY